MNALPKTEDVIVNFIVGFCDFFEDDDVLVAFLFSVVDGIDEVNVYRFVVVDKMLFGVFDDTVGTEGHEALHIAAEVSKKF